ncbi:MAG: sugar ABC transporter permease, partial [Treponema sp.]|nr:sugar ABC transporter permease [Treponema sp.]
MAENLTLADRKRLDRIIYIKRTWMLYVMLILPIIFFVVFRYVPMTNIVIAFKDYNMFKGVWDSDWSGLKWFSQAFTSRDFGNALRNTLWLNFLDLLVGFPAPIILAILLNELTFRTYKRITQTIVYLPHFLSWIIISGIATKLLAPGGGIVNIALGNMGIGPIDFLMDKNLWV